MKKSSRRMRRENLKKMEEYDKSNDLYKFVKALSYTNYK